MKSSTFAPYVKKLVLAAVAAVVAGNAAAAVVITEVDPYGSNVSDGYSADWFELTNTGTSAIDVSGWTMADDHAASNTSNPYGSGNTISLANLSGSRANNPAALSGVGSILPGQSVIYLEDSALSPSAFSALVANFETAWFGSHVPGGLIIGAYSDGASGLYGLSQTSDMVNIFNGSSSTAALMASVAVGADSGSPIGTFDNAVGLNDVTLTEKSAVGVDGAFISATGLEVGSPGVAAVPTPDSRMLMLSGLGVFGVVAAFKRRAASQNGATQPAAA